MKAQTLEEELARIVDAVAIHSPAAFTFAGRASSGIAMPMVGLQLTPDMPPLMNELVMQLYQHCFANRFTGRPAPDDPPRAASDPQWVESLAQANRSRERWEDGWQILHALPNGHVVAKRGNTSRTLAPGEFINLTGSGMALSQGTVVRIYIPRESRTVQPGYYFVFGETLPDSSDELSVVRFYWNVSAPGAPELVRRISGDLNRWEVPFRFKTPSHPGMFARTDTAVLYTPRRYAQFTRELASEIHSSIQPLLRDDVPLFTLRLAPGLAFAEDPGTQESFGMCRSRILAQGIWQAHVQGARGREERLKVVERQFQSQGISLSRPWLNPGSADEFQFEAAQAEAA
jgi:HopA1 effector protein family